MLTIDALSNIDALLGMTQFLDRMKSRSIIHLFNKVIQLCKSKEELMSNPKFQDLIDFIGKEWVFGALSDISLADRIGVLESLLNVRILHKRILGETCNMIMAD